MVASTPTHHHASPSPGSCAKVLLAASSASSMTPVLTWSSVDAMVCLSFPCTTLCRELWQGLVCLSRLNAQLCAIISSMARKYEMKHRAERMQETRRRITEAAVELHQTVGPARTTVSAIAEKAGVQRHTYYAHFPELKNLYQACMGHYSERNPVPEPSSWTGIADAEERLRVALSEVYAYYSGNEAMVSNVLRDAALDPIVQEAIVSFDQYWETVRDVIADAFEASGKRHEELLGAVALAQDFQTWRTLIRQQELSQDRAVELMVGMVRCLMRTYYSELQKVNPSATRASQH